MRAVRRSRVTPAVGSTMAMRRPASQLKSDDLPTFGRPTIATTGICLGDISVSIAFPSDGFGRHFLIPTIHEWTVSWPKNAFKAIGLAILPVCHPARQCRGPATVPRQTAIENMVLAVGDSAVTCYRQSLYNAKPTCPPSRHDDCTQAAWVCHWQSTGQAKSYSVDVGSATRHPFVGPRNCPLLFSGKTAILRQSRLCRHYLIFSEQSSGQRVDNSALPVVRLAES